jgi:hypothetical protein
MKKWFALAVVAVLTVLAVATVVSAQAPQPQSTPQPYGNGIGRGGMMGGWGAQGQQPGFGPGAMMGGQFDGDEGPIHDGMIAYLADKLGLTTDALEARLANGETLWQVASSQNVSSDDFSTWMREARNAGIDAALQSGQLTQAQADWMKQRSDSMPMFQGNFDPDDCPMYGNGSAAGPQAGYGMRGGMGGRGRWGQTTNTYNQ